MSTKDGGPAFPTHGLDVPISEAGDIKHRGMSLRAYLAGKALAGMSGVAYQAGASALSIFEATRDTADICVQQADAIIKRLDAD